MYKSTVYYNDNAYNVYVFDADPESDYPYELKINHISIGQYSDMQSALNESNKIILNDGVYSSLRGQSLSVVGV